MTNPNIYMTKQLKIKIRQINIYTQCQNKITSKYTIITAHQNYWPMFFQFFKSTDLSSMISDGRQHFRQNLDNGLHHPLDRHRSHFISALSCAQQFRSSILDKWRTRLGFSCQTLVWGVSCWLGEEHYQLECLELDTTGQYVPVVLQPVGLPNLLHLKKHEDHPCKKKTKGEKHNSLILYP